MNLLRSLLAARCWCRCSLLWLWLDASGCWSMDHAFPSLGTLLNAGVIFASSDDDFKLRIRAQLLLASIGYVFLANENSQYSNKISNNVAPGCYFDSCLNLVRNSNLEFEIMHKAWAGPSPRPLQRAMPSAPRPPPPPRPPSHYAIGSVQCTAGTAHGCT